MERLSAICSHLTPTPNSDVTLTQTGMGDNKATLSVHSLDTSSGRPANNLPFVLSVSEGDEWKTLSEHITNDDGRAKMNPLEVGFTYRIRFDTTTYFKTHNVEKYFYPYVDIVFNVAAPDHHHIPLLISPFGYTTYRDCPFEAFAHSWIQPRKKNSYHPLWQRDKNNFHQDSEEIFLDLQGLFLTSGFYFWEVLY